MIKLNVIQAINEDRIGEYTFHKNILFVGKNHDADLFIPEHEAVKNHLFIDVLSERLVMNLGKDVEYVLLNGKRTTKTKEVRVGDKISFAKFEFEINDFSLSEFKEPRAMLKENLLKIKENDPAKMSIVQALGKLI